ILQIEILDFATWIEVLDEDGEFPPHQQRRDARAVQDAMDKRIAEECREHKRKKADALLDALPSIRTQSLERAVGLPFDDSLRLIKKSRPTQQKPKTLVQDTNPWHLDFELQDRLEQMSAEEDENPETGKWRRVDTNHDVEKDE